MKSASLFAILALCSFGAISETDYSPPPNITGIHYAYNFAYNVYCQWLANSGYAADTFCAMHQAYQLATRYADATGADKETALAELMTLAQKDPQASITFGDAFFYLLLIQQHYEHARAYTIRGWRFLTLGQLRRELPSFCNYGECTPKLIDELAEKIKGTVTGDALIAKCKDSYTNSAVRTPGKEIELFGFFG